MPEQTVHRKPIRLAANAFHAALAGKWDVAERALQRLNDECGGDGVMDAMIALCDTVIAHFRGDSDRDSRPIRIAFWEVESGRLDQQGSDRVPAETQWAGKLIAARDAMDAEQWNEVLAEVSEDRLAMGRHVWALLQVAARTVNAMPRGYARMGQGGGDG